MLANISYLMFVGLLTNITPQAQKLRLGTKTGRHCFTSYGFIVYYCLTVIIIQPLLVELMLASELTNVSYPTSANYCQPPYPEAGCGAESSCSPKSGCGLESKVSLRSSPRSGCGSESRVWLFTIY